MVSRINWRAVLSPFLSCLVLFVMLGCAKAPSPLQDSTTKAIFFSTKDFRFYDLGFVKSFANYTSLELFNAGVVLLKMDCYNNKICLNSTCYAKDSITRRFFGSDAFRDLDFIALLKGKEIFNGENKNNFSQGFSQTITRDSLKLFYKVTHDSNLGDTIETIIKDSKGLTIFTLNIAPIQ